uniref:Immunoglobulin subtype domain-containing protein n=1 Tax=Knipowitschia caucasica TaxID=637954 RepID=A0AAV2KSF6_KNICA
MLMVLVLVLFVGFASAQEYSFYEVEEGEDFDVWLSSTEIDSSDLQMSCVLLTPSTKNVLQVIGGEELTGDQDSQFEGRVEYKRTALKQGQIGLLFRGLTPTDSGKYNCEVAAISGQWITLIYTGE